MEIGASLVLAKDQERSARTYASELNYFAESKYKVSRNREAQTVTITRVR